MRVLSDVERRSLRSNARVLHFKKNDLIYTEGETPRDLDVPFQGLR